jgi:hypothetical protein
MSPPLKEDEVLVLHHLVSGKSCEEIAATLDQPIDVVRNHELSLITWVLEQLGPRITLPAPPSVHR